MNCNGVQVIVQVSNYLSKVTGRYAMAMKGYKRDGQPPYGSEMYVSPHESAHKRLTAVLAALYKQVGV